MVTIAQTLREQFRLTSWIVNLVLTDTSNEIAIKRARGGEGASISWLIGHMLAYRYQAMNLLGAEKENLFESFMKEDANDGGGYADIAELLTTWNELHGEFDAFLEGVSDEQLLAPLPTKDGPHDEKRVLDTMAFFAWHEAHHHGQAHITLNLFNAQQ